MHRRAGGASAVAACLTLAVGAAGCGRWTSPRTVTFNTHIAPIIYTSCAPCHRPGEAAPFSLLSYDDVVKHAQSVGEQTARGHMPPWLPASGDVEIAGSRRLRPEQVEMIQRWIATGTPEGDARDRQTPPSFDGGWQLGPPDLELAPTAAYTLPVTDDDIYRNLVFHVTLTADAYVRAVEFKTNGAPIHHAVIRLANGSSARRHDGEDGQPGFAGMASRYARDPDGHFVGWAPGRGPILSPEGMPWRLPAGTDLVVEMHMVPPKTPKAVQPSIGVYFTATPPARVPVAVRIGTRSIDIPPGEPDYVVTETATLPVSVELLGVYPHAHYLGRDMRLEAARPDGTTLTLLHIPRWDFHWQQDYRFVAPVTLPSGTRLTMRYVYDNSDGNRMNPTHPPVRVTIGPRSVDEMGEMGLQVLTSTPDDAARLVRAFDERDTAVTLAAAEVLARREPRVAARQAFLGAAYLMAGRVADAIPVLETALRLDPGLAEAESDLGTAYLRLRRLPEALPHLARAVGLSPKDAAMASNWANALAEAGRVDQAKAAFAKALAIDPDFVDAHVGLASIWMQLGQPARAVPYLERVVELEPESPVNRTDLSSALAASGRFVDALRSVQVALRLDPSYGPARDNLRRLNALGYR